LSVGLLAWRLVTEVPEGKNSEQLELSPSPEGDERRERQRPERRGCVSPRHGLV
jgi:hypothetical protein